MTLLPFVGFPNTWVALARKCHTRKDGECYGYFSPTASTFAYVLHGKRMRRALAGLHRQVREPAQVYPSAEAKQEERRLSAGVTILVTTQSFR